MAKQRRKPSRKKTMQEVTSTLQDLINNELSDASLRVKSIQSRVEQAKHSDGQASPEADNTEDGPAQAANEQDDGNWIEALGDDLDEILPDEGASNQQPAAAETRPAKTGNQQDSETKTGNLADNKADDKKNNKFNDQIDMWDDDIPVLREVAAPPPAGKQAAEESGPIASRAQTHKLAVKIIARLNIELRKKGKPELEPLTINRLQRILEEELAQQAANVENSGHE